MGNVAGGVQHPGIADGGTGLNKTVQGNVLL